MNKLFVYGTLKSGHGNWNYYLNNNSKFLGKEVIKGKFTMVSLGGYPGVIPHNIENEIHGEVYEVSDEVYKGIERLEGYPHYYGRISVETTHGTAEMYILDERYLNHPIVKSGNW